MNSNITLGHMVMGTLLTRDLAACLSAYCEYLHVHVKGRGEVSQELARRWGLPHLSGHPYAVLVNEMGTPLVRIVEDTTCLVINRLKHTGWSALEIVVADVDTLAASLENSPFQILRPAANLSLSDKIRAVQVRGPCGEILHLSQINGYIPPFELPRARCTVDRVFSAVLSTNSRANSLEVYEKLSGRVGQNFEAKLTNVNQVFDYRMDKKHKVSILQLGEKTLIEIDQVDAAIPLPTDLAQTRPCSGILMVTFTAIKTSGRGTLQPTVPQILRGAVDEIIEIGAPK